MNALRFSTTALLPFLLVACGGGGDAEPPLASAPNPLPNAPTQLCSTAGLAEAATRTRPVVCMLTSRGEIVIELQPQDAPITSTNFLRYVDAQFYNNTLIHRIESDFVFQGGGYSPGGIYKPPLFPNIRLEDLSTLTNARGMVSMARGDAFDSANAQWFVNVRNNPGLDGTQAQRGYAPFGWIISGLPVVDAIKVEPVYPGTSLPRTEVLVYWVKRAN